MAILLQNWPAGCQVYLRWGRMLMKAFSQKLGIAVAGLFLAAGPALAQRPDSGGGPGGDRGGSAGSSSSSGGGGGGGGNIAGGGGGGGGGGSVGGGGGGGSSSPSASSVSSPSISMGDRAVRSSAPEHRVSYGNARSHTASSGDQARPRSSASGSGGSASGSSASGDSSGSARSSSGERAAPRSESSAGERAVVRGTGNSANGSTGRRAGEASGNNASGAREVPNWSRPRGDRPATDVAVPREGVRPPRDSGDRNRDRYDYGYYPGNGYYYDPYYYGGFGYGFGGYYNCGFYGYCNPGFYGYPFYSPYGFGYGIPSGYFDPYSADPYDYGAGYGAYSSRVYGGQDQGNLKLKVKPRNAKVYVDGFYVGLVDEFDGAFQKLTLNGGRHKVELRAEGYETTEFDVLISPEQTVTFAGEMKKVQ